MQHGSAQEVVQGLPPLASVDPDNLKMFTKEELRAYLIHHNVDPEHTKPKMKAQLREIIASLTNTTPRHPKRKLALRHQPSTPNTTTQSGGMGYAHMRQQQQQHHHQFQQQHPQQQYQHHHQNQPVQYHYQPSTQSIGITARHIDRRVSRQPHPYMEKSARQKQLQTTAGLHHEYHTTTPITTTTTTMKHPDDRLQENLAFTSELFSTAPSVEELAALLLVDISEGFGSLHRVKHLQERLATMADC